MYKDASAVSLPLHIINVSANTNMCRHRFLLLSVVLVLAHFPSASALDLSPTASPSIRNLSPNGSHNSAALPLNNTSTTNGPAYAFSRGFDKPYQRMTILVAGLFIVFLLLGFSAHCVTLRFCYNIVHSGANRNNEELPDNEQHAGRAGGGGVGEARGLEPWIVRSLPVVKYTAKLVEQEEEGRGAECIINVKGETQVQVMKLQECAVCLSEFEEGEETKVLPVCGHGFHKACIDMWLFSHTTCPICRLSLLKQMKGNKKSLQISTNQILPRRALPAPQALPRGSDTADHLEVTMASVPFDASSASTSSGLRAVVVNSYVDADDGVTGQGSDSSARNSSAALCPHFPSSA